MPFRLILALCLLILAGCTSSEPQKASYAPASAAPPQQSAPIAAAPPALQAAPVAHAVSPAQLLQNQPTALPPSDPAGTPQADTTAVLPPGATNCSTVDGVTLCDAPADSGADDSGAAASSTDDTLYTN